MNTTQRSGIMQRWFVIQHEPMNELRSGVGVLTPGKLEQQQSKLLAQRLKEVPRDCDRGGQQEQRTRLQEQLERL